MFSVFTVDGNHLIEAIKYEMFILFSHLVPVGSCASLHSHTLPHSCTWSSVSGLWIHGHFPRQQLALCFSKPLSSLSRPALWHRLMPCCCCSIREGFNLHHCQQVVILWLFCPVTRPAWSAGNLQTITLRNRFYYHLFAHRHNCVLKQPLPR